MYPQSLGQMLFMEIEQVKTGVILANRAWRALV
jgi:hypothetical protein